MINVNTLFKMDLEEILDLKKNISIKFSDKIVLHNLYYKDIIVFRYILDFYNYVDFDIISDLWIENFLVNGYFTNSVYLDIYSRIFKQLSKKGMTNNQHLKLYYYMYDSIMKLNRVLINNIIDYALSSEVTDILDIQFDNELMKSIYEATLDNSKHAIDETYKTLDNIMDDPKYIHNPIRLFYKSKLVSTDQIKQLLGSRGFITEMDSKIFNIPMTNSFALGFKGLYDAAIESRAGAKAMYLSSKAIQNSEYMSRELQLSTMTVEYVIKGDCKHPRYVDFFVRGPKFNSYGDKTYIGDLPNLKGKRYLDKDGKEKVINGDEEYLNDTFIKLRMAVYCGHKDKRGICSACIGEMADSILENHHLGHMSSVKVSSALSQALLSAKHLLKSASSVAIRLDANAKKPYLKFKQREAWGLNNLMAVKDIFSLNIGKMSRLESVMLVYESKKETTEIELTLKSGNRYAFFTIDMLSYILKNGYETLDEDYYMVDLSNFNNKRPIFMYEKVEFDFAALIKEFKSMLKSRKFKKVDDKIKSEYTPDVLVQKLFELVNNKLSVNIALLEIIVYAFTIQDLTEHNYDLGRNSKNRDIGGFKEIIDYRGGLGASYNWDGLSGKILNPILHLEENKCSHPMDVLLKPNEVIANDVNIYNLK